jgi:hypothetical protein
MLSFDLIFCQDELYHEFGWPLSIFCIEIIVDMVILLRRVMKTTHRYFRVDRREIAFLRFIFEAYDGIVVVKTVDAQKGIILLYMAPGCEQDVDYVLQDLEKQMVIEHLGISTN